MEIDLGLVRRKFRIPWLHGSKRKKRRASGVASRAKNAPKHCKVALGSCMRGGGGRAKAGKCMKGYWRCIKGS
jgi:hypothetical protein